MTRWAVSTGLVAALALAVTPLPAIAKQAKQLKLTPQSTTAIVVMKAPFWQPAPSMKSAFKLWLSAFDPREAKLLGGPYGGGAVFEAQAKKYADGYLFATIKPGRWVFQSYAQQDLWALCFNASTWQFDVKPGEVVYLGAFDAEHHRGELEQAAMLSGRGSITGYGFADFFDLAEGPRFAPVDETQLEAVRAAITTHAPGVSAPVRAASFTPATFGTGSTLFGERRCGGYFAKGAKKKS